MKKKPKSAKMKKTSKKIRARASKQIAKPEYYDKFDEKKYSGSDLMVKRDELRTHSRLLAHLERDTVKQGDEELPIEKIADEDDELHEDPRASNEGLGIESDEAKGEEAYPEIAEAEKDPDDEEEE